MKYLSSQYGMFNYIRIRKKHQVFIKQISNFGKLEMISNRGSYPLDMKNEKGSIFVQTVIMTKNKIF